MTFQIIIRNKDNRRRLGKTRSEVEGNLLKEGGSTMSEEQLDKLKYAERWFNKEEGGKPFVLRPPDENMDVRKTYEKHTGRPAPEGPGAEIPDFLREETYYGKKR